MNSGDNFMSPKPAVIIISVANNISCFICSGKQTLSDFSRLSRCFTVIDPLNLPALALSLGIPCSAESVRRNGVVKSLFFR